MPHWINHSSATRVLLLACSSVFLVGCSGEEPPASAPVGSGVNEQSETLKTSTGNENAATENELNSLEGASEERADVAGTSGAIAGTITFKGELPPPRRIQATKDPDICSKGEGEVQDVHVKDGKLAGVVVELSVRGSQPEFRAPEEGFVIRQKDCRFTNPMLVAYDGAELRIFNDDQVPHNVNSGQWNDIQGPGPDPIVRKINYSGVPFVRVTCNIHNWMETWVYVARSKFHAVSGDDGTFRIEGIPPGKYRGSVMHPTLGKQRLSVEVEAGKTQEASFEFEAP